jgi:hypothetical protein
LRGLVLHQPGFGVVFVLELGGCLSAAVQLGLDVGARGLLHGGPCRHGRARDALETP